MLSPTSSPRSHPGRHRWSFLQTPHTPGIRGSRSPNPRAPKGSSADGTTNNQQHEAPWRQQGWEEPAQEGRGEQKHAPGVSSAHQEASQLHTNKKNNNKNTGES